MRLLHLYLSFRFLLFPVLSLLDRKGSYYVWWNVPTVMCHKWGYNFTEVSKAGIEQNTGDRFLGDSIAILYDPGLFPSLTGPRNGGVPQEGNLKLHLRKFEASVNQAIPDANFSGLAIIDFEDWRPIWRQNWGKLAKYRTESIEIEKKRHPNWPDSSLKEVAEKRFEKAAYSFFEDTLEKAKEMRPNAKWGYYGFPYCFNYTPKNTGMFCSSDVQKDNDRSKWLYESSTALFPSIYLYNNDISESKRVKLIEGRLIEAVRIAKKAKGVLPIIPYATFKYPDVASFYNKNDMSSSLTVPKKSGASGVIIWGSSKDTSSKEKCNKLLNYSVDVIRPIVKRIV